MTDAPKEPCACADCGHEQITMDPCQKCGSVRVVLVSVLRQLFGDDWRGAFTPDSQPERIARRGQMLSQVALRMEIGDVSRGRGGAEALLYLADAIARVFALSEKPHLAIETVVGLFDKIDTDWLARNHSNNSLPPTKQLFADIALETAIGTGYTEVGPAAAIALSQLTDAIVCVAALNSEPRRIIEHVVQRLDETDVEAVRKDRQKR